MHLYLDVLLLCLALPCSNSKVSLHPSTSPRTLYSAISPLIRIVGRKAQRGGTIFFDWSSVQLHFRVQQGPASVLLNESACGMKQVCNSYAVFVNNTLVQRLNTSAGVYEYPLEVGGGGNGGCQLVRVEKITEARPDAGGVVAFSGVRAGSLGLPPPPMQRRIECIGDSMMCGAHSERGGTSDGFVFPSTCTHEHGGSNENSFLSWCPTLSRKLSAEYQMECCSGNGLVMTDNPLSAYNCNWSQVPPDCPVMPNSWERRLMCSKPGVFMGSLTSGHVCHDLADIGTQPLNSSVADDLFAPHAVFINLGQNDYSKPPHLPTSAVWLSSYRSFLRRIMDTHDGGAHIEFFLACGECRVCGSERERARAHIVKEVEDRGTPCNTIKLAPSPQVFNNKLGHQFGGAPLTHGSRMLGNIHLWRLTTGQEPGRPSPGLQRCSCPTKPAIHLDGVRRCLAVYDEWDCE